MYGTPEQNNLKNSFVKDPEEENLKMMNLRENFKKGKGRLNYSFKSEMNMQDSLMNNYINNNSQNIRTKKNQFVFRDCFTEDCFYWNKKYLSKSNSR